MNNYVLFLLLGLGSGGAYALLGLGLALEYRSSSVVNFAQGGLAMFCAYVYVELRQYGTLVFPWLGLPSTVSLAPHGLGAWPSLVVTLLYAAGAGALVYLLVFRPLRAASPISKIVASVGLMIFLQSLAVLKFGMNPRSTPPILPHGMLTLGSATVPQDRLWMALVAVLLAAVLASVYRFTRFGTLTEALSENEQGVLLLGWSPHRISTVNWAIATMLAAVAGILLAPVASLDPSQYTLFVVPALGCLLVARMRSFTVVVTAALALGMLQSAVTEFQMQHPALPAGTREGLPFLLIILALTFRGRKLPEAHAESSGRPSALVSGGSARLWPGAAVSVAACAMGLLLLHGVYRGGLIQSLITAMVCCSVVAVTGYVGQISLAPLAFAGIGGFVFAKLSSVSALPLPVALACAGLCAVPLGLLIALPALRVRGVQLAVVTLAAGTVVDEFAFNSAGFTGGFTGAAVRPASLFGLSLDIRGSTMDAYPRLAFGMFVLILLALIGLTLAQLRRTATGRAMIAVKGNERVAASIGVDVAAVKLQSFILAAAIAGVAGAVIGLQQGMLSGDSFDVFGSLGYLAIAYIGGITRVSGAVLAGLMFANGGLQAVILDHWIAFGDYQPLIVGLALIVMTIREPTGFAGRLEHLSHRLRGRQRPVQPQRIPGGGSPARVQQSSLIAPSVADGDIADSPAAPPLLTVEHLTVRRGGIVALDDLSLEIPHGAIVGLIGPNGAGKTTFIDAITGLLPTTGAEHIDLRGIELSKLAPHKRARAGLSRTFQRGELFDELTVGDNVRIAADSHALFSRLRHPIRGGVRDRSPKAAWALELLDLADVAQCSPADLSNGRRKLVGVARALAVRAHLVLLDEPAAGLDTSESRVLADHLRQIQRAGITILLVDHDMSLMLRVCDWVYVLEFGRLIASGPPEVITRDPAVLASYLGAPSHSAVEPAEQPVITGPRG